MGFLKASNICEAPGMTSAKCVASETGGKPHIIIESKAYSTVMTCVWDGNLENFHMYLLLQSQWDALKSFCRITKVIKHVLILLLQLPMEEKSWKETWR